MVVTITMITVAETCILEFCILRTEAWLRVVWLAHRVFILGMLGVRWLFWTGLVVA